VSLYPRAIRWIHQPGFSYLTLALLQLKVMWRVWDYKDLPTGDTASYFLEASNWFTLHQNNILWSPLYTAFLGTLRHVSSDVYAVMILHRLIIAIAVSLLVLAVMRKLLPSGLAWIIAAWWAVLPINFDSLYDVHLFSSLPVLIASLVALYHPNAMGRGTAIAILAAASIVVRNELSLATLLLVGLCLIGEIWHYRKARKDRVELPLRQYGLSYGVPLLLTALLVIYFYQQSYLKFTAPAFAPYSRLKHTLNICQIYAAGYQQRHPEWQHNIWTECQGLMQQTFGQPLPSLAEAFKANPQAILEHFAWNVGLTLNGLQLSLFNAAAGGMNPDYIPVNLNQSWVILPTVLVGLVLVTGLVLLYQARSQWWQSWLKSRAWGWAVILSVASIAAFVVIPMQRPRPSYLFSLAICLMAAVGMCLFVIVQRWRIAHWVNTVIPVLAIALLVAVPPYYQPSDRPFLTVYDHLLPFQSLLGQPQTEVIQTGNGGVTRSFNPQEATIQAFYSSTPTPKSIILLPNAAYLVCFYFHVNHCQTLGYADVFQPDTRLDKNTLVSRLISKRISLVYLDTALLKQLEADPETQRFLAIPEADGWTRVTGQMKPPNRWLLLQKILSADAEKQ
jgi:uncharacterized membrane protein SirB2